MAKKPLSGKRWFEALGRRAYSIGEALSVTRQKRKKWPMWAQHAFMAGWFKQGSSRSLAKHYERAQLHASAWESFKAQYPGLTDAELESRGFVKDATNRAQQNKQEDRSNHEQHPHRP